jgi:2,4'-dihydroxyacetophenone dioxygenase
MGENSEVMFNVVGSIEFYNEDNTLREIMDGFSFWRMYEEHCVSLNLSGYLEYLLIRTQEKNGVKPNMNLWY